MESRGYGIGASAGSCGTGEVGGVGTVELVCVSRLLRMGGESLPLTVWRSVRGGFTGQSVLFVLLT